MKKTIFLIFGIIAVFVNFVFSQTVLKPFPTHTQYYSHIKPSNYSQNQLDSITANFYDQWKEIYLRNDCDDASQYYIYKGDGAINVSEGQGYGMMIVAYMAGYDPQAKTYFDGLYKFYKAHPSRNNEYLMDWKQISCNDSPSDDDNSASDGDIDIAFALLLAHNQWGSNGEINYLQEALNMIDAIWADDINHYTFSVKLGDWSNENDQNYFYSTRSSDFILDHFRTFAIISENQVWWNVIDTIYNLINFVQNQYSPQTGLLPDFIVNLNSTPQPANAYFLEGQYDGHYYYNACRDPWRIATDYLLSGDVRAKNAIDKINSWLQQTTNFNVDLISNGYYLDGSAIYDWHDATFVAPFTVAAMLDTENQQWLNDLFDDLISEDVSQGDYYSNTIKMLTLIVISGNYWLPTAEDTFVQTAENFNLYPSVAKYYINVVVNDISPNKKIIISNLDGKILKQIPVKNNQTTIDISFLNEGIYFIGVQNGDSIVWKKFVKI